MSKFAKGKTTTAIKVAGNGTERPPATSRSSDYAYAPLRARWTAGPLSRIVRRRGTPEPSTPSN